MVWLKKGPVPLPAPPDDLIDACASGNCVLFAGAGVGAQAGFPTWRAFVGDLVARARRSSLIPKDLAASLDDALEQGETDATADTIVSVLREKGDLSTALRDIFGRTPPLPELVGLLPSIGFSGALTTNFDTLLERAFDAPKAVFTPQDSELLLGALSKRTFFLLKLYGCVDQPETLVVAPAEFADSASRNQPFVQFFDALFYSRSIFFLGASLEGIEAYLGAVGLRGRASRPHFALVNVKGRAWQPKAEGLRRRFGITTLPYTATSGFPEPIEFVRRLRDRVVGQESPTSQGSRAGSRQRGVLRRVRLENVGPFDTLDLTFDRHWTILLGDNGVGKSNILRAIGVALAGRAAEPYAWRIVKAGRTSASILLETEADSYITTILKTSDGARLSGSSIRPTDAEGWLVLGFPPIRTISWDRRVSQLEGRSRPIPDDVLPVVKSEPDPRLDQLKTWIVDLHLRGKEQLADSGTNRYQRLLDEFFVVLDELTPGLTLRLKSVNSATREVLLTTDDGDIPIEAVSQGSTSLLGWVWVVLQRLHEVYGTDDEARTRAALILIDEIDAHMHPSWQQAIVGRLNKVFPNAQFVATTHSPLIVPELQPSQVYVLARDPVTRKVSVGHPDEDFSMMRADQVLTSSAFGLSSTRGAHVARQIERYAELLGKDGRSEVEIAEFNAVGERLASGMLSRETGAERQVEEAVKQAIDRLGAAPEIEAVPIQGLEPDSKAGLREQLADLLDLGGDTDDKRGVS